MVLFRCGECCCQAHEPFIFLGAPTSVEVDIVQGTDHDYKVTGTYTGPIDIECTAKLPPLTGTYSLTEVSGSSGKLFRYEDDDVLVEFAWQSGSNPEQGLLVCPKIAFSGTLDDGTTTTTLDAIAGTGGELLRNCVATETRNQMRYQIFHRLKFGEGGLAVTPPIQTFERTAGRAASFTTDCRLPIVATESRGVRIYVANPNAWEMATNTFPGSSTQATGPLNFDTIYYYHFDYSVTINACRLIYSGETVQHMNDLSPVSC